MTRRTLVIAAVALVAGCAPPRVQPERSLREMYEVQAEVNKTAKPYNLGTGDAAGRVNLERSTTEDR